MKKLHKNEKITKNYIKMKKLRKNYKKLQKNEKITKKLQKITKIIISCGTGSLKSTNKSSTLSLKFQVISIYTFPSETRSFLTP